MLQTSESSCLSQARCLSTLNEQQGNATVKRGKTLRQLKHPEWRMPLITNRRGLEIVQSGIYNKGTAFSPSERERLGLRGLVPSKSLTMEQQIAKGEFLLCSVQTPSQSLLY